MRGMLAFLLIAGAAAGAPLQQMHDHAMPMSGDGRFNPWIISDGQKGFLIAYVEKANGVANVMLQRSLSGTNAAAVRVNDRLGDGAVRNENPPKLAIGNSGEVYVVWANEKERWKGNIRFARSTDGGRTFSRAIDVNSGAALAPAGRAFESIVVDAKGRIYVAWIDERNKTASSRGAEIWMATSDDGGRTFSRDRKIVSDVCECCRTALAIDRSGSVYLSYRVAPATGPMFRDIAVARSDDGGKTFVSSIVHHDGWELNACPIAGATMTIDSRDRVHVAWFTEYQGSPKLLYSSSQDKGRTFTAPRAVDANQTLAKHAHLTPLPAGDVAIVWDDSTDGHSVIKWGTFDPAGAIRVLGSKPGSYPIIAVTGKAMETVGLSSDGKDIIHVGQ